jgi:hypothetical protein
MIVGLAAPGLALGEVRCALASPRRRKRRSRRETLTQTLTRIR